MVFHTMVHNPRDVDIDRSVDCVFCDALADERETINLWNNPRFPDGEAHTDCYEEWTEKPTYAALNLELLEATHPDNPDAGDWLKVGVRAAYLSRDDADDFVEKSSGNYAVVELTSDVWPEY